MSENGADHRTMERAARTIVVRRPDLGLGAHLPELWFDGRPGVTHFMNALGALFPEGERFFVRSVRAVEKQVESEALRHDVQAFVEQEVRHGSLHDEFNDVLRAQGIDLSGFLGIHRRICRSRSPRFLRSLMLAITVSVEHFTAVGARLALRHGTFARAHPSMRRLYEWHALEELEHKAVAFDVLKEVSGSYLVRITAFLLCLSHMLLFISVPLFLILKKSGRLFSPRVYVDLVSYAFLREKMLLRFVWGLMPFFKPSFHPEQVDETPLLEEHRPRFVEAVEPAPRSTSQRAEVAFLV